MTLVGERRHSSNDNAVDIDQLELHKGCPIIFIFQAQILPKFYSATFYSRNHSTGKEFVLPLKKKGFYMHEKKTAFGNTL